MNKRNFFIVFLILIFIIAFLLLTYNSSKKSNSGELIKVSYEEIVDMVDNKDSFILVVSQSTCSHCATYRPKLINIADDYGIDIYYIDYDTESESVQKKFLKEFNLSGATPTTMFIKDGKEASMLNRLEGDLSEDKVIQKFEKMGFIEE